MCPSELRVYSGFAFWEQAGTCPIDNLISHESSSEIKLRSRGSAAPSRSLCLSGFPRDERRAPQGRWLVRRLHSRAIAHDYVMVRSYLWWKILRRRDERVRTKEQAKSKCLSAFSFFRTIDDFQNENYRNREILNRIKLSRYALGCGNTKCPAVFVKIEMTMASITRQRAPADQTGKSA